MRDLSDVRDVVRAYRLLVEHGEPGEVYNVCSGTGVSIGEIADGSSLAAGDRRRRRRSTTRSSGRSRCPRLVGDPTKLVAATGWSPRYTLDETLDAVLADARDRAQGS